MGQACNAVGTAEGKCVNAKSAGDSCNKASTDGKTAAGEDGHK